MLKKVLPCVVMLLCLTAVVRGQTDPADVFPKFGKKGNSIDLTIKTLTPLSLPGNDNIKIKPFFVQGQDTIRLNNIEQVDNETRTATIDLSQNISPGQYDFVVIFINPDRTTVQVNEKNEFQVEDSQIATLKPNKGGKGENLNIEITSEEVGFGQGGIDRPSSIVITKGPTSNVNTTRVKAILVENPELITGTVQLFESLSTGKYDVLFQESDNDVILRLKDAFEVLKFPVGLPDGKESSSLETLVYPNPVQSTFNLSVNVPKAMQLKAQLMTTSGKTVKQLFNKNLNPGEQTLQNLSLGDNLSPGLYWLKLSSEDQHFSQVLQLHKE